MGRRTTLGTDARDASENGRMGGRGQTGDSSPPAPDARLCSIGLGQDAKRHGGRGPGAVWPRPTGAGDRSPSGPLCRDRAPPSSCTGWAESVPTHRPEPGTRETGSPRPAAPAACRPRSSSGLTTLGPAPLQGHPSANRGLESSPPRRRSRPPRTGVDRASLRPSRRNSGAVRFPGPLAAPRSSTGRPPLASTRDGPSSQSDGRRRGRDGVPRGAVPCPTARSARLERSPMRRAERSAQKEPGNPPPLHRRSGTSP
jgi:hypothetical protein